MVVQIISKKTEPTISWEPLPTDFELPDDPVENIQQPSLAAALTDALGTANLIKPEMLIVSNFGLVATVNEKIVVKAPDWLYVPQVNPVAPGVIRRSYTPYIEGSPIAVVMEFLSHKDGAELSLRARPPYGKLYFYEQILQVPTYVIYDPYALSLEVRYLQHGSYVVQSPNEEGRFWIPELELFLGMWTGKRYQQTMNWLRWWDQLGNLLLWSEENAELASQQAELANQRAIALAAKLRELGVDPNTLS